MSGLTQTLPPLSEFSWAIVLLDRLGLMAFCLSGVMVGLRKRFDLFGVSLLGCVTAVGGGTLRDVISGTAPPGFLKDESILWIALITAIVGFVIGRRLERLERPLLIFDTLGLAIVSVSSANKALELGYGPLGVVFIGMITGVGGGMIRDVLSGEIPSVLYRDVYATAAALGALLVFLLERTTLPNIAVQLISTLAVIVLRFWVIQNQFSLPPRRMTSQDPRSSSKNLTTPTFPTNLPTNTRHLKSSQLSENTDSENTDSKNTDSENTDSENTDSENTDSENTEE
jgi:uncharacterized membrane protein YeiH